VKQYPTVIFGYISGEERLEKLGGGDRYLTLTPGGFIFLGRPTRDTNGDTWATTHIQYKSHFGFLLFSCDEWWKLGFAVWIMPHLGDFDLQGNHKPGTELGWMMHVGRIWRAGLQLFEWTFYGPFNRHWD